MRESDFDSFSAMLDDVATLLTPAQPLTSTARAMYFRATAGLSLEEVRAALDAHVRDPQRGRFFPKPADVMAQVSDGRPGAEEAWAIAVRGADENASIVWTEEVAEAWGIAKPVLALGDEVGARVAFRDAYGRIVAAARKAGTPMQWFASLGHDPAGREEALREEARVTGREMPLLEPPKSGGVPLLELSARWAPPGVQERLMAIRDRLVGHGGPAEKPSEADEDRARTAELKARSAELVAEYSRA